MKRITHSLCPIRRSGNSSGEARKLVPYQQILTKYVKHTFKKINGIDGRVGKFIYFYRDKARVS